MELQSIKQRFGIIGNSSGLNRALNIAVQVAPTDLTVLITGESGTGKEVFPQIIHQLSARKHGPYIAVNCGAIPEGTIDSELFGHEKGSFTGAHEARKGYFEVASGGTIFLDEVAELPISTQVRLLRVLETGEFLKVGSSKVIKTDVRVIAATNVNVPEAIDKGNFRQDLYYRLSTVPIFIPPLRERNEDIHLLFRKFASDFAEKYRMPSLHLTPDAVDMLVDYRWDGNVRQLKNITEQISIIESEREITAQTMMKYLPEAYVPKLPVLYANKSEYKNMTERDILYKILFDMRRDITELKQSVVEIIRHGSQELQENNPQLVKKLYHDISTIKGEASPEMEISTDYAPYQEEPVEEMEVVEESLSIAHKEADLIRRALEKHRGKRKLAARDLGISERTLYRKIKEYKIT
ncbi:MAG: sigma 54-interacting transcriptional regulator [Bacteroidales bacterium]|jgi:transcriptional regulator with PAS, ATPase and Fis domain|nr:sigma 54-interacting transcriptional regulator [Bacteroidales bacterium]MDD2633174.1 sigma 54-interacting transcriptional regulator [Bacteroidales bacterium]MDD3132670.1 sigma 54-interacting transcriptional regulator [Bacteroidales bacterium]MDD4176825.1 sigma 54-interacting transcriptional regulator [Bacteroidales bacterium]MDY0335379.1 sigma 54-interacting transcriptional regulator [Bacteroidales bacterium]